MTQSNPKSQTAPLLDLDTLDETRPVRIDGHAYDLMPPSRFGMREMNRLQGWVRVIQQWGERDLSDEEVDEAERKLEQCIHMVLPDLPDEVLGRLDVWKRIQIVNAWATESGLLGEAQTAVANGNRAQRRTTAK